MTKDEVRTRIEEIGILTAIRVSSPDLALFAAGSVYEAGIPIVEVTMTVPGAMDVIAKLARKFPDMVVGAGTVLDAETAKRCVGAGARFVTSPGLIPEVVEAVLKTQAVLIPGALTPSEVIAAWQAGGDFVKIFPCALMGGDKYIRALRVPLPQIPLIASGGVNQVSAGDFILAGAKVLGIGSELIPREALHIRQSAWIHELARRFIGIVRAARSQLATN